MGSGQETPAKMAREQVKLGKSRSVAVDALVSKGVPRSDARVAVDDAIERSGKGWLPAGTGLMLIGVGMIAGGVLLSMIVGNRLFIGLIVIGLVTIVRGLLGGSTGD